jgi:hypothetical protein
LKILAGLTLGLVGVLPSIANWATDAVAMVSFHFERPAAHSDVYTFEIHEDGSGSYSQVSADATTRQADPVKLELEVSPKTVTRIFQQTKELSYFNLTCSSKLKGIADTGTKTLSYEGPGGSGHCTYNFSENKTVQALTDTFQAMQLTIVEGRKLESEHKYDRLGLSAEMKSLVDLAKDGRAIEMGNIEGTLKSIAADSEVLDRVRLQAATLLNTIER